MEIFGILRLRNLKILKICYFSKLSNFRNLMVFEIGKFLGFSKSAIVGILQIGNFWSYSNRKFLEFSSFIIFVIVQIGNFWNCPNCKINKFLECFQLVKRKFGSKNGQFSNHSFIQYSAVLAILAILIFALWYKSIFSIFISQSNDW